MIKKALWPTVSYRAALSLLHFLSSAPETVEFRCHEEKEANSGSKEEREKDGGMCGDA